MGVSVRCASGLFLSPAFLLSLSMPVLPSPQGVPYHPAGSPIWQSKARLRHRLTSTRGDLIFNDHGVEFRSAKGSILSWPFVEIRTVTLATSRRLLLTSYANRRRHWPGDREFRFQLSAPIPPDVAAALVNSVGKPAVNGDPDPGAPSFAMIPARHRTRTGGTNGVLRFGQDGIDYIASPGDGGRSWRWADIETLASPDPYHFRVGGYLETFEFELKQPMNGDLFGQLWDRVYARDLNVTRPGGEQHADQ